MGEIYRWIRRNMTLFFVLFLLLVIAAAVAAAAVFKMNNYDITRFEELYRDFKAWELDFENTIASLENIFLTFIMILLLYLLKAFIPFFPLSGLFIISGLVYTPLVAIGVNLLGLFLNISARYYYGSRRGGGHAGRLVSRYERLREAVEPEGGKIWILFLLRLFPGTPTNLVSRLYGSMECRYSEYCIVSLTGFLPRVILYTLIGNSVFNPLSARFLVSLSLLIAFSVACAWGLRYLFTRSGKKPEESAAKS